MESSFYATWESWVVDHRRTHDGLERQLHENFRRAWRDGSEDDQYAVLQYVFSRRAQEAFDVILQALRRTDRLATDAAAITFALVDKGSDLGPTLRDDLTAFMEHFPESPLGTAALATLDRMEARRSDSPGADQ